MKVWRKLCEGKNLTASEQEMIRSEIASYAAKFQGKTQIHVSFGNDSFDITYPKPIQMTRKKDMVDWTTNAHFDASVDMDCRAIINYAKEVLAQDAISDISMRMVVNKIVVHQNEDKTLDIKFEMNGKLGDNKEIEIPD